MRNLNTETFQVRHSAKYSDLNFAQNNQYRKNGWIIYETLNSWHPKVDIFHKPKTDIFHMLVIDW